MDVLTVFEYIGVFAFAMSGALTAIDKKMDIFGIYVLSFMTAMGGGVVRDVVMNVGVPIFFSSYTAIWIIMATSTMVILLGGALKWSNVIYLCDAIGLGVFVADSGSKAILLGYNLPQFLFVSVIAGVGGGVLRDMMCQRVPIIFRKEVYATAGVVGALTMWYTWQYITLVGARYLVVSVIILIRMLSLLYKMQLPKVTKRITTNCMNK